LFFLLSFTTHLREALTYVFLSRQAELAQSIIRLICMLFNHIVDAFVVNLNRVNVSQHTTLGVWTSCRESLWADLDTSGLLQPTPSKGQQSWHFDTLASQQYQHLPPVSFTTSDDYGPELLKHGHCRSIRSGCRTFQASRDYGSDGAVDGSARAGQHPQASLPAPGPGRLPTDLALQFESVIKGPNDFAQSPILPTFRVAYTCVL
jgi:hypothetical protein